jgi:hypothetical protein
VLRAPHIHLPLCSAVVEYGGTRALVSALLPLRPDGVVMGSNDGGVTFKNEVCVLYLCVMCGIAFTHVRLVLCVT